MKKIILVLAFLSVFLIRPLFSQVDTVESKYAVKDTQDVKVTLFDTDDLFEITLKFDLNTFKRVRSDTTYLDAILTYYNNKTDSITKKIKVRARGNIRRTGEGMCDFPPLMLNFKMKDSGGAEFAGINKLKIVPYCKIGYEDYVLREYLVYKLYNVLTDYSFRVRLFKITYINSVREKKPLTQYGFAIEPVTLLEKRTNSMEIPYAITQRNVKPEMLTRMALFNYMIGNTDWSVPIKHNIVLLSQVQTPPNQNLIVTYDFDYAGLVNFEDAVPFETLPIKTVRERLYTSVCRSETEFTSALNEFLEKKDEFYKVINDFPYLSARSKKDMIMYLDGFFLGITKRNSLVNKLLSDCRWFENQSNLKVK
jgi:hypothetical protein